MRAPLVLVVDDEGPIREIVRRYLEADGVEVIEAADGVRALEVFDARRPDVVVLDVMLPGIDGVEVLRRIRATTDAYVLMLTARAEEADRLIGLSVGADDYMTKPFSPRELVARVKALLRRTRSGRPGQALLFRHLRIDSDARMAWKDDGPLELTTIEFDLLLALARHSGRVLSRDQIIEQVWGADFYGDDRVVDVHLGHLRRKLQDGASDPAIIATVRGVGYRFDDEAA